MKIHYLIITFFVFNLGYAQSKKKPITEFSQNDIGLGILVDVRTPKEYNNGHVDNAVNINLLDKDFIKSLDTINRDKLVYVYCKKGSRSARAAHILDSLGFKEVVDLEGGYDALIKNKNN